MRFNPLIVDIRGSRGIKEDIEGCEGKILYVYWVREEGLDFKF